MASSHVSSALEKWSKVTQKIIITPPRLYLIFQTLISRRQIIKPSKSYFIFKLLFFLFPKQNSKTTLIILNTLVLLSSAFLSCWMTFTEEPKRKKKQFNRFHNQCSWVIYKLYYKILISYCRRSFLYLWRHLSYTF